MSNYCMLDSEDNPMRLRANITPYTVLNLDGYFVRKFQGLRKKIQILTFPFSNLS